MLFIIFEYTAHDESGKFFQRYGGKISRLRYAWSALFITSTVRHHVMRMHLRFYALLFFVSCVLSVRGNVRVEKHHPDIGVFKYNYGTHLMVVGSGVADEGNAHTLSGALDTWEAFNAISTSTAATVNNIPGQTNPLIGKKIEQVGFYGRGIAAVVERNQFCFIPNPENGKILHVGILDEYYRPAHSVAGMSSLPNQSVSGRGTFLQLLAVRPASTGVFGDAGSIILSPLYFMNEKGEEFVARGMIAPVFKGINAFCIGAPLASIDNDALGIPVALYQVALFLPTVHSSSDALPISYGPNRLFPFYVGISGTASHGKREQPLEISRRNSSSPLMQQGLCLDVDFQRLQDALIISAARTRNTDLQLFDVNQKDWAPLKKSEEYGVRSVAHGGVRGESMMIRPIAPDAAIGSDSIIGARGAGARATAYAVCVMRTTNLLYSLIVHGGVGDPAAVKNTVYALPLVNDEGTDILGVLAKKDAIPVDTFDPVRPHIFQTRFVKDLPEKPEDLYTSTDVEARVGGGPLAIGDITEMQVVGDSVFVSVAQANPGYLPGIFYSQALFDEYGRIKGWTEWSRAGGVVRPTYGFAFDQLTGNFWHICGNVEKKQVTRTQWQYQDYKHADFIREHFAQNTGGVQGLFDIPATHKSFSQNVGERTSWLIVAGYKKVMVLKSGIDSEGVLTPVDDFTDAAAHHVFTGAVLDDLGAIIAATVITDGTQSWLLVGGSGGLAILAHADGSGFPLSAAGDFENIFEHMTWKKLGNYRDVIKLIADGQYLYIVSASKIDRIVCTQEMVIDFSPTTLITPPLLPEGKSIFFSDAIASRDVMCLATNAGMFKNVQDSSVRTLAGGNTRDWEKVPLAESPGPVTRFFVITPTGHETDFACGVGGNIYVLSAYVSYHQARVYRFTFMREKELLQLPDFFMNFKTFYLNVGDYRNNVVTDGALLLLSRSAYKDTPPFVETMLSPHVSRAYGARSNARIFTVKDTQRIGKAIRRSMTGSWLIPGDFGVGINE